MADGSIRIETKLDNSALKQQIKELERELTNIQKEQAKTEAQVSQARAKYDAEREFDAQFPEEFSNREDIDARAAKELDPLIAKQEDLNQKKQTYLQLLKAAKAELAEQNNIAAASKEVDNAVKADAAVGKVQTQAQYNSLLDATAAKMAAIEAAAAREAAQRGLTKEQILAANAQYKKLSDTMSALKAKAADFGREGKAAGEKTSSGMKKAEKSVKKVGSATKSGIAGLGKMGLAMMAIRFAMRAVSSATREYMAVNTELEGQMNTLKALWGQVLGPAIEWFINLLINAISHVNAFVEALTGINYIARANEAALKKQAKAASSAAKAQLASFDEQTKLNDPSSGDAVTLLEETLSSVPAFMQKITEQIKSGDWYGAGKTAGDALMGGINSVDWEGLGTTIADIVGNAFSFALGFVLSIDVSEIYDSILNLATGIVDSLSKTIQGLDWMQIGRDIVDFLSDGMIYGLVALNPMALIIPIMLDPEATDLANSAAELIGSILGALASAIVGAAQRFGELAYNMWTTMKTFFDGYVDWEGTPEEIIQGLWDGITAALEDAGEWIYNNIWVPFRDGFKKAFEIHSPSKKMEEFGGNIIDGLKNGILNAVWKVVAACTTIWTAIKACFSSVGTWFKNTFYNAWVGVKNVFSSGGKIFSGIKEGIESTFKTIVNGLIDGINKIITVPFNSINSMLNGIRDINVFGITPFKDLWGHNPLAVPQIPKLARGGIVNNPGRGIPAIIGEAGAEAVLPLENNTEWMDILADKIGGGTVTIPITLDGKRIATYMVDIQKKKAFAMNGA